MNKRRFLLIIFFLSLFTAGCNRNNINKNEIPYHDEYSREVNDNDVQLGRNVNQYNKNINEGQNGNMNDDQYNIIHDSFLDELVKKTILRVFQKAK